jgi:type I restriction enzyme S subunit
VSEATSWPVVPLDDAVEFLDGQRRPVKASDRASVRGKIPYYGASGIVDYVNDHLFNEPLILLGEDGENILSRAVPLAFKIHGRSWVNNHAHVLRPRPGFDIDYLTEYLESLDYSSLNTGTAQPKLNKHSCKTIEVVAPPIAHQQRIASVLRDADDQITTLNHLIVKKAAMRQGMMQELLTAKSRLPGFTDPWELIRLGDVTQVKTGSRNNQDKSSSGIYPFFVRSATVERIDFYSYDCEAILVPGEGAIGSVFHYVNGKFEVHQRVYKVSEFSPRLNARFAYFYMRQHFGRYAMENSVKATVDSLRLPTFLAFEMSVPTDVTEQRAIAGVLTDAERELELLRTRLTKAKAVRSGMVQELLTGRTRLSVSETMA